MSPSPSPRPMTPGGDLWPGGTPALSPEDIRTRLATWQGLDLPTHGGHTMAYVYDSGLAEVDALGKQALAQFSSANGLDPTAFPSLLVMENDLIAWAGRLLHAPDGFAGSITSGGTESILLAVLAARDGAPGIAEPSLILPTTAHAAFHKAAHYFGVRPVVVDVDQATYRADPAAMAAAIDASTVLVVASAPSYAHGVIDPVPEIAAAASAAGVRCHVDACIGGWVLPWLDTPWPWDFTVPGVTSMSVDLHKYAYAPKGVSALLHRSAALRQPQLFACADWPGYTMLNATTQSTRSGGPLAGAWAVTHAIGDQGYADLAAAAYEATRTLAQGIAAIPGLRLVAEPDSTLVCLTCDDPGIDVFTVADEMAVRGWYVQPQLSFRDMPATLHLTLSPAVAGAVPEFLAALAQAVHSVRTLGPVQVPAELVAVVDGLDPAAIDEATLARLLASAGLAGSSGSVNLPERMAPVNALLDRVGPAVREALLVGVLDLLSRPATVA
ncbi:MAG: pyridoxal phosphate-dependent decarboxylase family protein [Nostocoides sp.]